MGNVEVFEAKTPDCSMATSAAFVTEALRCTIFKDGFDDQIATGQVVVFRSCVDVAQNLFGFFLSHAASFDLLRQDGVTDAFFSFVGRFLIFVSHYDFHPGGCRHVSDAVSHQAGTKDTNLFRWLWCDVFGAALALLDLVELSPECGDHVTADLPGT